MAQRFKAAFFLFLLLCSLAPAAFCEDNEPEEPVPSANLDMIEERFRSLSGSLQAMPQPPDMKDKQIQLPGVISRDSNKEEK